MGALPSSWQSRRRIRFKGILAGCICPFPLAYANVACLAGLHRNHAPYARHGAVAGRYTSLASPCYPLLAPVIASVVECVVVSSCGDDAHSRVCDVDRLQLPHNRSPPGDTEASPSCSRRCGYCDCGGGYGCGQLASPHVRDTGVAGTTAPAAIPSRAGCGPRDNAIDRNCVVRGRAILHAYTPRPTL